MDSETIVEGRMGYWLRGHEGERNFFFLVKLTLISFTGTYEPTIDLLPTSVAS